MLRIYVEGGGDAAKKRCKKAFASFLAEAGFAGRMPKVLACGSRQDALEDYKAAIDKGHEAILLVDSEGPVDESCQAGDDFESWKPWKHLEKSSLKADRLKRPAKAKDNDCHLMVECTENWSAADTGAVENYFGVPIPNSKLRKLEKPELIRKADVLELLKNVARHSRIIRKQQYEKGTHTFDLLRKADPNEIARKCPWARRFIERLEDSRNA